MKIVHVDVSWLSYDVHPMMMRGRTWVKLCELTHPSDLDGYKRVRSLSINLTHGDEPCSECSKRFGWL